MKKIRILSTLLLLLLLLPTVSLPVSAASTFSYNYADAPLMTSEMREHIEKYGEQPTHRDVLVGLLSSYADMWVDGFGWKEIMDVANTSESNMRFVAVKGVSEVQLYRLIFPRAVTDEVRSIVANRLFAMKDGYRYQGEIYEVEMIYWFDGVGEVVSGGYAAIVTNGGTFFEHYNQIYKKQDNSEILVFTEEEFSKWYPEFERKAIEDVRYHNKMGWLGENEVEWKDFRVFLTANGFTPRYGEAQGVTRRVLTYGGMTLAVVGIAGGITYAAVRHKRKKKAALPEAEEIA